MSALITASVVACLLFAALAGAQAGRPPLAQPAPPGRGPIPPAAPRDQAGKAGREASRETGRPTVRDETFTSESLGRQMKYRVVLPAGYEASVRRYPVLYLLHGLTGSFVDWESKTDLADHLRGYRLIVVMPDAGDSWYTNSAGTPADKFEDYIARDLVREVDGRFRSMATRHGRAIAGLSMGGYGSLKFGLKYPGTYAFAGSFSGALGVMRRAPAAGKPSPWQEGAEKIYGPPGSQTRADNDIVALADKAEPSRMPYFYLDCGTEDGLLASNREFVAALQQRKIAYEYRELPGAHTWSYWDRQFPQMLRVLAAHVDVTP
jgi:S-formylglutathione hydrolase FrmB